MVYVGTDPRSTAMAHVKDFPIPRAGCLLLPRTTHLGERTRLLPGENRMGALACWLRRPHRDVLRGKVREARAVPGYGACGIAEIRCGRLGASDRSENEDLLPFASSVTITPFLQEYL
jgi:hypothetical protein